MKLRKIPLLSLFAATAAIPFALSACGTSAEDDAARSGTDGADGADGENGSDGTNGTNGADGAVGDSGTDGVDGTDGTDGADGADGEDGLDADIVEGSMVEWVKARVEAIKAGAEDVGEYLPLPNRLTDSVETTRGLTHNVVVRWMDPLNFTDTLTTPRYGANGDFTAYVGDGGTGELYSGSGTAGWFWSNHEYVSGSYPDHTGGGAAPNSQALQLANWLVDRGQLTINVASAAAWVGQTAQQSLFIEWHKKQLGGSYFRVVQDPGSGTWTVDRSATPRRYDATNNTDILVTGATLSDAATVVQGTQNNCSGAHTPWGTVLSGEENAQDFFGDLEVFFNDNGGYTADPSGVATAAAGGDIVLDYAPVATSSFGRNPDAAQNYPRDHYGYITEFDVSQNSNVPYDSTTGNGHQKLGAMGRARWENATTVTGEDWKLESGKPIVLYAGDDRRGGRIFKFVSSGNWTTGMTKAQTRNLLASGKLYVAHFASLLNSGTGLTIAGGVTPTEAAPGIGQWIELSLSNTSQDAPNAPTLGAGTKVGAALGSNSWNSMGAFTSDSQLKSVLYTASNKLGVRELNRPEDLEYNPFDQSIYIAFTNHNRGTALDESGVLRGAAGVVVESSPGVPGPTNTGRPDRNGAIFVLHEDSATSPGSSTTFTFWAAWSGVRAQNTNDPFIASCPDNIVIDPVGGVWFGTDGNPGNNNRADAVYYLDLEQSKAYRVASAPSDAEATGPTFSADGNTLFFNVQHPGEGWYSSWPGDSPYGPMSSLVAIYPRR